MVGKIASPEKKLLNAEGAEKGRGGRREKHLYHRGHRENDHREIG
jgi:hypothetical protein